MVFIYKLIHPVTGNVFYVGQTTNIKARLSGLLNQKQNTRLAKEIGLIKFIGKKPIIKVIRKCPKEFKNKLESYFIAYYSEKTKHTLCNLHLGSFFYINKDGKRQGWGNCRKSTSKDILRPHQVDRQT